MRQLNETVYALYEPAPGAIPNAEVVFLHGICEQKSYEKAHIETWTTVDSSTSGDICWPEEWLGREFPQGRILSVSYNSCVNRSQTEGTLDLYCTAENLVQDLTNRAGKVGQIEKCPLILVGQDIGGLIIKAICLKANGEQNRNPRYQTFLDNVKGVFYYGTPHQGFEKLPSHFNSPLAKILGVHNADTSRLNDEFSKLRNDVKRKWKTKGIGIPPLAAQGLFHQARVTPPEASMRFDVDEYYTTPTGEMQSVCQPKSVNNVGFYYLLDFIKDVLAQGCEPSSSSSPDCEGARIVGPALDFHRDADYAELQTIEAQGAEASPGSLAAYNRARAGGQTLGFRRDKRYVRLQTTEERVRKALTQLGNPKLVLLYGGTGMGKSCLAQDVALQIESSNSEDAPSSQQSDLAASSSTEPNELAKAFDTVVYLECGLEAQFSTVRLDLQQKLGRGLQAVYDKSTQMDSPSQTVLRDLLQKKKILIILDDVWRDNINIVSVIIDDCGKDVKCLVTSQVADLCRPLNCSCEVIRMEKVNIPDARRILASHILGHRGGSSSEASGIPKHLEGFADAIINKVDANPLAMACAATVIDPENFQNEEVWRKLDEYLSNSLHSEDIAMIHSSGYPYSFWAAMQQSVNRLREEEKAIFVLASSCRGPSVPEEVIEYLYKLLTVDGLSRSQVFQKAKKQIEGRQLIQVREGSWSIHSLLQEFADGKLQVDKANIKSRLKELSRSGGSEGNAESNPEVDIVKAIIQLYTDDTSVAQQGAFTVQVTMDTLKYVIEPITRLLLSDIRGRWTPRSDVIEVFLTYLTAGSIHEDAAVTLLRSSNLKCITAMTDVLLRFAQAAKSNVSVGDGVIYALLGLLGDKDLYKTVFLVSHNDVLPRAALAIFWIHQLNWQNLHWLHRLNRKNREVLDLNDNTLLTYFTSALEEIITAMTMDGNHHLQHQAMLVLQDLSAIPSAGLRHKIASPRMLRELTKILIENDQTKGGEFAASILGNLSLGGQYLCEEIGSNSPILQGLVSALTRDDNLHLQACAARALAVLAKGGGASIALKISSIPESLERLVLALTKASNPELQEQAVKALGALALRGGEDVCVQISNVPTALEKLVCALGVDNNSDFQVESARALKTLANSSATIAWKISCCPESLERLVHGLTKDNNPDFQAESARVLKTLAHNGNAGVAWKISSCPESLERLVHGLTNESHAELQGQSVMVLTFLALRGGWDLCARILNVPTEHWRNWSLRWRWTRALHLVFKVMLHMFRTYERGTLQLSAPWELESETIGSVQLMDSEYSYEDNKVDSLFLVFDIHRLEDKLDCKPEAGDQGRGCVGSLMNS